MTIIGKQSLVVDNLHLFSRLKVDKENFIQVSEVHYHNHLNEKCISNISLS